MTARKMLAWFVAMNVALLATVVVTVLALIGLVSEAPPGRVLGLLAVSGALWAAAACCYHNTFRRWPWHWRRP